MGAALVLLCLLPVACRTAKGPAAPAVPNAAPDADPRADIAPAQEPLTAPAPGWTESAPPRQYVGKDLFNHIDGGAEVFLEIGFRDVTVRTFSAGQATITLEVYAMTSPTAARGMYLRFRGRGSAVAGVTSRNVGDRYQITAQKDRYFIQITNASGAERCLPPMVNLANQILAAIPQDGEVPLLGLLPAEGRVPGTEAIVCGPYALQNIFTLGDGDILQLQGERCGVAADYTTENGARITWLIVAYRDSEYAQAAFAHLADGLDPHLQVLQRDEDTLVLRDLDDQFGSVALRADQLDIRLHLPAAPGEPD